ncbi:hypothetical protein [Bradyrhizobium sp. USDA 4454]
MILSSGEPGCAAQLGAAFGLELGDLPDHQPQPLVLARNLLLQPHGKQVTVTSAQLAKAFDERAIQWIDIADALSVQECLDAVEVSRALLDQMLAFAAAALAILILNCRHVHHAARPRLAAQIGEEGPHQLLQINPVGLGAPCATAHLDAGGIDLMIDDALLRQPAMQPMAIEARFVARHDADRPAA